MSIRSLFNSQEKLFAEWMMGHEFNHNIQAELRFSGCNPDSVKDHYYTIPREGPPIEQLSIRKLREKRLKYFDKSPKAEEVKKDGMDRPRPESQKQSPVYQLVHGPVIQKIEKNNALEVVRYGNFCGRTHFKVTKKQTGYFLVDGWVVVSVPKIPDEKEFKFSGSQLTVVHQFQGVDDPVSAEIQKKVSDWFSRQRIKLAAVCLLSFGAAVMVTHSLTVFNDQAHLNGGLLLRAVLVSSIAMQALGLCSGIKLVQLYFLEEKMALSDLGQWVYRIQRFAEDYPSLPIGDQIRKFFTPKALNWLDFLRKNTHPQ